MEARRLARFPFSDRKIDSLKVPAKGQIDHYDIRTQGLGIRLSYGGSKIWFLRYSHGGHRRRLGLGRYPAIKLADARKLMLAAQHETMFEGSDPALRRRAKLQSATLLTLAEAYIEEYAKPKKRSWAGDNRILITGTYFKPLHARRAIEVTRADLIERLQKIRKDNGGVMANRALAAIRGLYQWGIRNGGLALELNPAQGIDKPGKETERERVFSDDEIKTLWTVFGELGVAGHIMRLLLITAQRLNECAGLEFGEIEGGLWTIPGARTKNGRPHVVPLSGLALEAIAAAPKTSDRFVFASPSRRVKNIPMTGFSTARANVRELSGIEDFQIHDLRRTAATGITRLGFTRFLADRVMGHTEQGVGRVYDRHEYLKEKTEALDAWALHLEHATGRGGNVVTLAKA